MCHSEGQGFAGARHPAADREVPVAYIAWYGYEVEKLCMSCPIYFFHILKIRIEGYIVLY